MPRSALNDGHQAQDVGAAIIAAWWKALPSLAGEPPPVALLSTRPELTQVLSYILEQQVTVIYDDEVLGINVVVPRIPNGVKTRADLLIYLQKYHNDGQGRHYHEELGQAVLFGCR